MIRSGVHPFLVVVLIVAALPAPASAVAQRINAWEKVDTVSGLGNPLAVNPLNPRTVYGPCLFGNSGGIQVSRDDGKTWIRPAEGIVASGSTGLQVKSISIRASDSLTILAGQEGEMSDRVVKSTDGGATWTETLTGAFNLFGVPVEYSPAHPDTVWAMMGRKLYRSADFGSTWSVINPLTPFNTWCDAAVRPDSAGILYVGDNSSGIWKTTDGGATFRLVHATTGEIPMIAVDPAAPRRAFATRFGGGGGVVKTTDGGETWSPVPDFGSLPCWGVAIGRFQSNVILVGTYQPQTPLFSTFISTDTGATWTPFRCGLTSRLNYGGLVLDSARILLLQADGIYRYAPFQAADVPRGTVSGTVTDTGTGRGLAGRVDLSCAICDSTIRLSAAVDSTGTFQFSGVPVEDSLKVTPVSLTCDPELPFAHLELPPIHTGTSGVVLQIHPATADLLLSDLDQGKYLPWYRGALDSLGLRHAYWDIASRGPAPFAGAGATTKRIAILAGGDDTAALDSACLAALSAAVDSGVRLFLTGQNLAERNFSSAFFQSDLGAGYGGATADTYVAGDSGEILNGLSFFTAGGDGAFNQFSRDVLLGVSPSARPVGHYLGGPDSLLAALRVSGPGGGAEAVLFGFGFESISTPEARRDVMRRVVDWLDGTLSAVETGGDRLDRPSGIGLGPNYPNPFNPETTIPFTISERSPVSLRIYDLLGREVADLIEGIRPAGRYSAVWRAEGVAGGVYIARIRAGGMMAQMKLLYVR